MNVSILKKLGLAHVENKCCPTTMNWMYKYKIGDTIIVYDFDPRDIEKGIVLDYCRYGLIYKSFYQDYFRLDHTAEVLIAPHTMKVPTKVKWLNTFIHVNDRLSLSRADHHYLIKHHGEIEEYECDSLEYVV